MSGAANSRVLIGSYFFNLFFHFCLWLDTLVDNTNMNRTIELKTYHNSMYYKKTFLLPGFIEILNEILDEKQYKL